MELFLPNSDNSFGFLCTSFSNLLFWSYGYFGILVKVIKIVLHQTLLFLNLTPIKAQGACVPNNLSPSPSLPLFPSGSIWGQDGGPRFSFARFLHSINALARSLYHALFLPFDYDASEAKRLQIDTSIPSSIYLRFYSIKVLKLEGGYSCSWCCLAFHVCTHILYLQPLMHNFEWSE